MVHRFALRINLLLRKLIQSKNKTRDTPITLITLWIISSLWHFQIPLQLKVTLLAHRNFLWYQENHAKCAFLTSLSKLRLFLSCLNGWISHKRMSYIDLNNRKYFFPLKSHIFCIPFFLSFFSIWKKFALRNIFVEKHIAHLQLCCRNHTHLFIWYESYICVLLMGSVFVTKKIDFWNKKFCELFRNQKSKNKALKRKNKLKH